MSRDNFTTKEMLIRVLDRMDEHDKKLDAVVTQTTKTNERVTTLESSFITKADNISKNQQRIEDLEKTYAKFTGITVAAMALVQILLKVFF